jgi:hypothetical protein
MRFHQSHTLLVLAEQSEIDEAQERNRRISSIKCRNNVVDAATEYGSEDQQEKNRDLPPVRDNDKDREYHDHYCRNTSL